MAGTGGAGEASTWRAKVRRWAAGRYTGHPQTPDPGRAERIQEGNLNEPVPAA